MLQLFAPRRIRQRLVDRPGDGTRVGHAVGKLDMGGLGHPARFGRKSVADLRNGKQPVDAVEVGGERRGGVLRAPVDHLFRSVGIRRSAEEALQAHVAHHLQFVYKHADQFGHRLVAAPVKWIVRTGVRPKAGKTVLLVPCGDDVASHRFDISGNRRAIAAAIGIPAGERVGTRAVKNEFERAEALHGDTFLRKPGRVDGGLVLAGKRCLHLFQADSFAIGPKQHAFQPVFFPDRPESDDFDRGPRLDRAGKFCACSLQIDLGRRFAQHLHRLVEPGRMGVQVLIGRTHEAVDRRADHVRSLERCGCRGGRQNGQRQQQREHEKSSRHHSDSRNFISASRSAADAAAKLLRAFSASPPCHRIASVRLRARPSCRKKA